MDLAAQKDLAERLRRRDEAAFTELVRTYEGAVRGYTALWAPSRDEAEDIAQEVFLAALRGIDTFDPSRDLKNWLFGIARNLTRQAWKRVYRNVKTGPSPRLDEILERHAASIQEERSVVAEERLGALRQCIDGLPERLREMVLGYVAEDLCSRALAQRLQTNEGSLRATLTRLRRLLKDCVEKRMRLEGSA